MEIDPDSDEGIIAKIAETQDLVEGLEGGTLQIGVPFEGRTKGFMI
jgi:hypothetical protein